MNPKQNPDVQFRSFDEIVVLVNSPQATLHELSRVASRIWELCDGQNSVQDIASNIIQEYDVSEQQALSDIKELLNAMSQSGLVLYES